MTGQDFQRGNQFDQFTGSYDHALAKGLSSTGENREFFANGRIRFLQICLGRLGFRPGSVMEFGCGTGFHLPLLREITGAKSVLGIDVSEKSIEVAKRSLGPSIANFARPSDYRPAGQVDLAFCNGVFHHIEPGERASAVEYIRDCIRPGGMFALWENNPWNPGTRLVMKRIPFDRDAITLTASEGRNLLKSAGLRILRIDYLFIFPHALRWLRPLEFPLSRLPLGGQYQILAQKPAPV